MQEMRGLGWGQPGQLGEREGGSRGDWIGPQGSVEYFQFSQARLRYRSLEARVTEDRTVDLSELTLHQAAIIGKQASGKRNQRSYIIHHKGFPLPFCFAFQNSPQGIGPLFWGPWGSGLGGSERVLLCPGGGGGGLFLERVELPLEVWVLRGRVEGGPAK